MLNEVLFFLHIVIVLIFSLTCLKIGKKALVAFIALQAFLANLFVLKQIALFGFIVTATDVFTVGSLFSFNLLQEYFGKEEAKKTITVTFVLLLFATLMSQLHLFYAPSAVDTTHAHYEGLLSFMPRLAVSSFLIFFFCQYVDMKIFSFLKTRAKGLSFSYRALLSMGISQFFDTLLFSFIALYGVVAHIWHVVLISYMIKLLVISFNSLFCRFSKRLLPAGAL